MWSTYPESAVKGGDGTILLELPVKSPPLLVVQLLEVSLSWSQGDVSTDSLISHLRACTDLPNRIEGLGGPGRLSSAVFTKYVRRTFQRKYVATQTSTA